MKKLLLFKVLLFNALSVLLCSSAYTASGLVYVVNSDINTVDVLNIETGLVVHTYSGFNSATGIVVNPANTKAYVTNSNDGSILNVIDIGTQTVSTLSITGGNLGNPQLITISADGNVGYVVDSNNRVLIVNLNTGAITQIISSGFNSPFGIALSSDGLTAYVTNSGGNSIAVVSLTTFAVNPLDVTDPSLLSQPEGIAIKNNTAYVVNTASSYGAISVIDLSTTPSPIANNISTGFISASIGIALSTSGKLALVSNDSGTISSIIIDPISAFPMPSTLSSPNGIAINGNIAYVVNTAAKTVSVIDLPSGLTTHTISGLDSPNSIALSADKSHAYVTNDGNNTVSVIDLISFAATEFNITSGALSTPMGIAIYGTNAYVCNNDPGVNSVSVIDISSVTSGPITDDIVDSLNQPIGIALSPDGNKAYVTNSGDGSFLTTINFHISVSGNPFTTPGAASALTTPGGIVLSPDGTMAYTVFDSSSIAVINLVTNTITNVFSSPNLNTPNGLALNSTGTGAFITNNNGSLSTITFPPNQFGSNKPAGIKISPDGSKAYLACGFLLNGSSNNNYGLSTIDLATGKFNTLFSTYFNEPSNIALNSIGNTAYITNVINSSLSVVDLTVSAPAFLQGVFPVPVDIVIDPSTGKGYVINFLSSNNISVVDFVGQTVTLLNVNDPESVLHYPIGVTIIGSTLYVCCINIPGSPSIVRISNINSPTADAVNFTPTLSLTNPTGICATSDGSHIYVVDSSFSSPVYFINALTGNVDHQFTIGNLPQYIALNPANTRAYVTYSKGRTTVYDTTTFSVIQNLGFNSLLGVFGNLFLPPSITSVSPIQGSTGTLVRITGSNFTGATSVLFGSNPATFIVNSDGVITATAPAGSGTVDIKVTTSDGTSVSTTLDQFSYSQSSSFSAFGKQKKIKSLFQKDIVNEILWSSVPAAAFYRVFDENFNLLFHGPGVSFFDHNKKERIVYHYFVVWVDSDGNQSLPIMVTIP